MLFQVYPRPAGTTQAMLVAHRVMTQAGGHSLRPQLTYFPLCSALFWIRRSADVTHDEIGRGVSAGLAGNIPAIAAFQHRICRILRRPVDRGAVGAFADPAGCILY